MSPPSMKTATLTLSQTPKLEQHEEFLKWPLRFQVLVIDLGDVFCSWSKGNKKTPISAFDLKKITNCPDWHEYERGKVGKQECFAHIDKKYNLKDGDLEKTIKIFGDGMQWNDALVKEMRKLKIMARGKLQIVLMTNISQPDFEDLRSVVESWNIFDKIFTSAAAGTRKPELIFYKSVLQDVGVAADFALFVDDKTDNVIMAQTAGMHGILFQSTDQVVREIQILLGDPVRHAKCWAEAHAREMWSETESGVVVHEQFNQLVMLEMSFDRSLLTIREGLSHWNAFLGEPLMTDADFPDDFDTTTLALANLDVPHDIKKRVMDEMLEYPRWDGLFMTYFDSERPRTCPYVSANILKLFYAQNRGHEVADTLDCLIRILESGDIALVPVIMKTQSGSCIILPTFVPKIVQHRSWKD